MGRAVSGDAERAARSILPTARRVLVVGIGGGGDVVGAFAAARLLGRPFVIGGLTWERLPFDPVPGPRRIDELVDAEVVHPAAALAGPATRTPGGVLFGESHAAAALGEPVVLIDPNPGPSVVAQGLRAAAERTGCDGIVLVDVGGDVLAHGDEAGLGSPLADAVLLAAGTHLDAAGFPVVAAVVGSGCDGELTPDEVAARIDEAAAHDGVIARLPLDLADLQAVDRLLEVVPTEASALAIACARGARGPALIRSGRRTVVQTEIGGQAVFLTVRGAVDGPARLAGLVHDAGSLEDAETLLAERGITSELAWERAQVAGS
ncbi:MAG: DUF1152 domain-containing protein [Solirubrobacteraceae bacterium]